MKNKDCSIVVYNKDEAIAAVETAPTLERAKAIAKKYCDMRCACKLYGGASKDCTQCPLDEDHIESFYENNRVIVEPTRKRPSGINKHKDGRHHNVTNLESLHSELRDKYNSKNYNSKNIAMKGLAKKYFMEIAHKCGVPKEITSVTAAKAYAKKTTLRYQRKTIAEYMIDEYNERW